MKAVDLIDSAYRRLFGGRAESPAITALDRENGLAEMRLMLQTWDLSPLNIYKQSSIAVLTTGANPHTLGTGGDWNTDRPIRIDAIKAMYSAGFEKDVKLLDWSDYAAIRMKGWMVNYPQYAYVANDYPLMKVYLWPVPASGMQISLWTNQPLDEFESLADTVTLPPGYESAIAENLAVRLGPIVGIDPKEITIRMAANSLRAIQRINTRVPTLQPDPALLDGRRGGYNIITDGR